MNEPSRPVTDWTDIHVGEDFDERVLNEAVAEALNQGAKPGRPVTVGDILLLERDGTLRHAVPCTPDECVLLIMKLMGSPVGGSFLESSLTEVIGASRAPSALERVARLQSLRDTCNIEIREAAQLAFYELDEPLSRSEASARGAELMVHSIKADRARLAKLAGMLIADGKTIT